MQRNFDDFHQILSDMNSFSIVGLSETKIKVGWIPSSETQGQIVGARESLNGRENITRRKVKDGEKSRWGQCLTRQVPNGRPRSVF